MTPVVVLTERHVRSGLRELDLIFAVIAPVATFIGFTFVLDGVIDTGGMSYYQYVLPAVVVQAMLFGALTTTDRAAREHSSETGVRLRTFPIWVFAPLTARMLYTLIRGSLALIAAIGVAHLFGFRMTGGFWYGAAFVGLALTLTLALSLGADATGTRAQTTEVASQLLLIPQLLLVLLSTGMAPVESFPSWLHPFVRYQPVSQVTETLRNFADGHVATGNLLVTLAWCLGLLVVFGALSLQTQRRL